MIDCRYCKTLGHCYKTRYVWLKAEKRHGIDRSGCAPTLTLVGFLRRLVGLSIEAKGRR